jgi:LmbE family N-acetylglucosaminyl deacetylase
MNILVIEAHPQYAGMFIAGTLYKHIQNGDNVTVVALSDAEGLTNLKPMKEIGETNKQEMLAAAEVLGLEDIRYWGYADTYIQNTHDLRLELNHLIREVKPEIIITHWPKDTLSDLRETGMAAIDAAFNALLVSGRWVEKLPSHWTSKMYGFQHPGVSLGFKATTFVDISDVVETKIKAMDCFELQIEANFDNNIEKWRSFILAPNRYWGLESGVMYAEPYGQLEIHEVHNKAVEFLVP